VGWRVLKRGSHRGARAKGESKKSVRVGLSVARDHLPLRPGCALT
jgi:hypothetical protein